MDKEMREAIDEVWRLFRETDTKFKETDARFNARMERLAAESRENWNRLESMFGLQWGRMLEALMQPGVIRLFRERGIDVHYIHQRSKSQLNGRTMEVDLILTDEIETVVVEVKSTMRVEDVDDFLDDLAEFPYFFPRYSKDRLYGAVAALEFAGESDRYAYRRGLFVLAIGNEGLVQLKNDDAFRPRNFLPAATEGAEDTGESNPGS